MRAVATGSIEKNSVRFLIMVKTEETLQIPPAKVYHPDRPFPLADGGEVRDKKAG